MHQNKLLVIIVSYNAMSWAERCYRSLRSSLFPCDVITIDNGSTDGTQDFIKKNYPEVDLRQQDSNIGFGLANNIGLQKALNEGYEFAYLLNQDAWVEPDTFSRLIQSSKEHPEYGILSPMQLQADKKHFDRNFTQVVLCQHQLSAPYVVEDAYFNHPYNSVYEVTFVMAAHWLITRRCIEQTGGFSPSFFLYGEDDNYLDRVQYWKMKIGIVPTAQAVHDRGSRREDPIKRDYYNHYVKHVVRCSKPISNGRVWKSIWNNLTSWLHCRNRQTLRYTVQLFHQRHSITNNRLQSLQPCAFLLPIRKL